MPPLASIGKRFVAFIIDTAILMAVFLLIVSHLKPAAAVIMTIVTLCYFAFFESSKYRGTPGKIAFGLEVTDLEGKPISWKKALLRAVIKGLVFLMKPPLTFLGLIGVIGFVFSFFTEKKQALHDILAKTLVVENIKDAEVKE